LTLTCFVYNNITVIVTKGYHGCKCCGPSINARWSNHIRKLVYECSRVFLPEEHPYRRVEFAFNGKLERTHRPKIMTPKDWIRTYDTEKKKKMEELFDSNGEPMFDDPKFFYTC
jgi:hypothetical protein